MGNPFDRIKAETAQIKGADYNSSPALQRTVRTNEESYASIYDEYKAASSDLTSISDVDIKAAMEQEVQDTQDRLNKQMRTQAWISFGQQVATALPGLITSVSSVLTMSKATKAGDTSAAGQSTLQQLQTKLTEAKTQSTTWGQQITDATNAKPTAEANVTKYNQESVDQQKLFDEHDGKATNLQNSLDNESDSVIVSAKEELTTAKNMKTKKTVTDAQGNTKEVEDPTLKQQKDQAIQAAERKISERKEALKTEIANEIKLRDEARDKKRIADENKARAEEDVTRYKNTINELTPKKNQLDSQIKQMESEIARLKGESTDKEKK